MKRWISIGLAAAFFGGCAMEGESQDAAVCAAAAEHIAECVGEAPPTGTCDATAADVLLATDCDELARLSDEKLDADESWYCSWFGLWCETVTVQPDPLLTVQSETGQIEPGMWRFTMFVTGAEEDLARVSCVEYLLHPSFPNYRRTVCERGDPTRPFLLTDRAWGSFQVHVNVYYADGSREPHFHDLLFTGWP